MKTYSDLYPAIYGFHNLHKAYRRARRGKTDQDEVLKFSASLEEELIVLQNELIWKTYEPGLYRDFYVYEPKQRLIRAAPFRDRVVHHALCRIIEPLFEEVFIYDSYACRMKKGTHAAANRLTKFLRKAYRRWNNVYCLKGDIAAYFPSISHEVLMGITERRIKCENTIWLISKVLESSKDDRGRGVPIGNLTSQLFANIYLNELDYFVKHVLRIRFYLRYMDDFVILGETKEELHRAKAEIGIYLAEKLCLVLNRKTMVFPARCGVEFVGYRIWKTHRLLRKSNVRQARKRLRRLKAVYESGLIGPGKVRKSLMGWLGHAKHCNTYNLRKRLLRRFVLARTRRRGQKHTI